MSEFDLQDWRRDLEASMRSADWRHVGVLLDRLMDEFGYLDAEADYWLDAAHVTTPKADTVDETAARRMVPVRSAGCGCRGG